MRAGQVRVHQGVCIRTCAAQVVCKQILLYVCNDSHVWTFITQLLVYPAQIMNNCTRHMTDRSPCLRMYISCVVLFKEITSCSSLLITHRLVTHFTA